MTANEYQAEAMKTASGMNHDGPEEMLLNGVLGLCGESGEAADLVKKARYQGHELDKEHVAKELGDVAWYIALSAYALGYSMDEIFEMNIEKLRKRYPSGTFDAEHSLHREAGDV